MRKNGKILGIVELCWNTALKEDIKLMNKI